MEQQINIAALLKDCPKGTKLYSPISGECELDKVMDGIIYTNDNNGDRLGYNSYGQYLNGGECLLFPSKEVRDWGCFRVKYVHLTDNLERNKSLLALLGDKFEQESMELTSSYFIAYKDAVSGIIKSQHLGEYASEYILSTGTELKLEEEQPKFKVGDAVVDTYSYKDNTSYHRKPRIVVKVLGSVLEVSYKINSLAIKGIYNSTSQYDTVNFRFATPEEIDKWNKETLEPNHLHYSKSKRKIIDWFLPFDKVIVKDDNDPTGWIASTFSHYWNEKDVYVVCSGRAFTHCLSYNEKTAKLIGTTDDYEEE